MSEVRQAHLSSKQLGNDCNPQRQNEEDVRDSDVVAARQLIRLSADLIHVESNGKHHSRQTEQNHYRTKRQRHTSELSEECISSKSQ